MAQVGDSETRDVGWFLDLGHGEGAARALDHDLRTEFIRFLRPRAERHSLDPTQPRPLREPTVTELALDRRTALRGSDVRVTWQGLNPRNASVTVIGPDRTEHVVQTGNSITVRATVSGPVILRLRNERRTQVRISDVLAGEVEVFELPEIRIPTGILPAVPFAQLPPVHIPQHSLAALRVPVPRLHAESTASVVRQVRVTAPRDVGAASSLARLLRFARRMLIQAAPRVDPGSTPRS